MYEALGKRIPAIYAYARFLLLEPNSARSASTAEKLRALLADSLSVRPHGDGNMTITVAPDSDGIDGDVTALVLSLAMTQTSRSLGDTLAETLPDEVARQITAPKGAAPLALASSDLSNFFQITAEMLEGGEQQVGFVWEHYVPYFAALHGMGFTELATH